MRGVKAIKLLAPSRREKGQAFELLMRQVLDSCGLSPLRSRLKVSGAGPLLDIRGRQRKDATPFLAECRALSREVTPQEVQRFFRRYRRERRRTKKLQGFFLSCTSFSPKALKRYQALAEEVRQSLHLVGPDVIAGRLAENNRLLHMKALEEAIAASSAFPPGSRFLATCTGNLYWVQIVLVRRRPTAFLVLEGRGGAAPRPVAQEIKRLEGSLRDKRFLDAALREQILIELLAQEPRTTEELAQALRESPHEVLTALQWMEKEGIVVSERASRKSRRLDRYRPRRTFPTFLHLARQFLAGPHRFAFLSSGFAAQMIATGLASYLEEKFRLKLPAEDLDAVLRLLTISPAALHFALFSSQEYVVRDRELDAKFVPNGEREKIREAARSRLISDLILRTSGDSIHEAFPALLAAREVRAYLGRIGIKAATMQGPLFSLHTLLLHTLPREKPPMSAELSLECGAVMMHMQEHEHAIQHLDRAIRELKDPIRLKTAWNNRGLCYFHKRRYQEAIECFNEAIKIDGNLKQAWFNKAICLREVGDTLGALRCARRAVEIDPAYKEAKDILRRLQH
jgi:tetratricopeptide (TPR) repeat protein